MKKCILYLPAQTVGISGVSSTTYMEQIEALMVSPKPHVSALRLAMDAADPAARAALSFQKLRNCPLDMISSGLRFFGGDRPTDPFIACQRREIFPSF